MPLIVLLTGILSGVALRSIVDVPQIIATVLLFSSLFSGLYLYLVYKIKRWGKPDSELVFITIFLFAIAIGIIRFAFAEQNFEEEKQASEKEESFSGIIDEIPIVGESNVQTRTKTKNGYVLLRIKNKDTDLSYGDRVTGDVICELPETFETNTGTEFDYPHYLMARGMHHVCQAREITVAERHQGSWIREQLFAFRVWFSGHIDSAFRNPHSGLVKGVLLGDKSGLGKELKSEMTVAGVIHIAVLSGSNIALVAAIIFGLTKMLSYNLRIILSVTVVLLFVMLSGAEPPALRAGILVVIIFLGKFLHRELHVGRGLLLAAFIMVFINPFSLIYDMSFQLSFLATIGIVYVAPWVEKFCGKITQRFGLREVVAGTLGAQIAVTPLLMYSTGAFSIVSLPANVLIVWAVPMLMALGFFGGALHAVSIYLALPIAFLGELISGYIIFITKLFAHMSYAQILF